MGARQISNIVGLRGPTRKSGPKWCLVLCKKYRTKEDSCPEKACRSVLRLRLSVRIHRDECKWKTRQYRLAQHTGIIQYQQLFHLFFVFSIYSSSLFPVMVMHIPRCAARLQFFRSAAIYHYTLNDSTTIL